MAGEAGELSELLSLHTATDKKRVPSTQSQNGDSKRPRHPPDTAFLPAPRKAQPDLDIEPFSGLRILPKARALSRDEVAALCQGFAVHKLESVPRLLVQPALGSWLTIGVLVDRGAAKVTQSGGKFCIWKVCDLRSNGTTMSIFLFGEACEVAWKYLPGSVLAIISARALPPKGSSAEAAMSINKQAQLVRIGQAADFGLCQGERRDGKPCGLWVNLSECEYCSFHVLAALRKSEKASKPSSQGSRTNGERARATCKPTQGRPPDTAAQKVKEAAQLLKSAGWELQPPDPNSSKPDHTRCLAPSASSNAQHDTLEIRVRRAGSSDKSLPIATTMRASKASQSRGRSNTQLDVFENAFGKVDVAAASQLLEERAIDDRCLLQAEKPPILFILQQLSPSTTVTFGFGLDH
ncbi:hypothetical protein AB1Y20_013729 [Prymnesium parvum]|uniref:Zinc finger Mcm10/DnaG-type domain-containing protein n=1 Tax=Prymnesium parvum TaxID=97485 RepID=A0AB34II81_PRYPA